MFYIGLDQDNTMSGNYTPSWGGEFRRRLTDEDKRKFNLNDDGRIKQAISDLWGHRPTDVFFNDPTHWSDASYSWLSWQEVNLVVRPTGVQIQNVNMSDGKAITVNLPNPADQQIEARFHNALEVSNTVTSTWSQSSSLSIEQEIGVTIKFFGSRTTVSFQETWERGGSKEFNSTIGTSTDLPILVPPRSEVTVSQLTLIGKADAVVTYQASIDGLLFANYSDPKQLNGFSERHHFYGLPVSQVVSKLGKPSVLTIQDTIKLSSTAWVQTDVSRPRPIGQAQEGEGSRESVLAVAQYGAEAADRANEARRSTRG